MKTPPNESLQQTRVAPLRSPLSVHGSGTAEADRELPDNGGCAEI
jgi:hypothetical protein